MTSIARNYLVQDTKSKNDSVQNTKSKDFSVNGETVVFTEVRTINKGQPVPWGLNWLITYPIQLLNFPAIRT